MWFLALYRSEPFYQAVKSFDFLISCSIFNSPSNGTKNIKRYTFLQKLYWPELSWIGTQFRISYTFLNSPFSSIVCNPWIFLLFCPLFFTNFLQLSFKQTKNFYMRKDVTVPKILVFYFPIGRVASRTFYTSLLLLFIVSRLISPRLHTFPRFLYSFF